MFHGLYTKKASHLQRYDYTLRVPFYGANQTIMQQNPMVRTRQTNGLRRNAGGLRYV